MAAPDKVGALVNARTAARLAAMRIEINGEPREVASDLTVQALLTSLGLGDRPVAVERNALIVPRAEHGSTKLADGDKLEVVQFVGGG
jgi:thiamine biosynthesis protein ThiS